MRSAKHALNRLVKEEMMFIYIEMQMEHGGTWDSINNVIESKVNSQIREMLHAHRGLSELRRIKAVFWWCYMHSEYKVTEAEMIKVMKTDEEVEAYRPAF